MAEAASSTEEARAELPARVETYCAGRWENLLPLGVCAVFTLIGFWLAFEGERVGWFLVLFFGAGAGLLGWKAATSEKWRLEIGESGFAVVNPMSRIDVAWTEVSEFGLWKHRGGVRVAWRRAGAPARRPPTAKGARTGGGWDGALQSSYGMRANELRDLLEERRRQAIMVDEPSTS